MIEVRKSHLVLQTNVRSSLGAISMAAFLKNSPGVGEKGLRTFSKYALVYLLEGSGFYADRSNTRRPVVPGDMLILFPDVPHAYGPSKGGFWSEFYIIFDGPIFDLWRQSKLLSDKNPVVHLDPTEYWLNELTTLLPQSHETKSRAMTQAICRLQLFLAKVLERQGGGEIENPRWYSSASKTLQSMPEKELNMQLVARKSGHSYESFRKKFKKLSGVSPGHYRAVYLMNVACQLICSDGMTNKEIAEKLCFCDEFHFTKSFKNIVGMSTREFRTRYMHRR